MNGTMSHKLTMSICGLAAIVVFVAAPGCSSSGTTTGTGGSTGGGGHGTGGSTTGVGGNQDAGLPLCTGVALPGAPLITDFSDVTTPEGGTTFIVPGKGGVAPYNGTSVAVTGGALVVTGTIAANAYAGVTIYFDSCIDASTYQGVKFKLTGSFGTCDMLKLGVNFPQIEPKPPASGHGVCVPPDPPAANNCYGPGSVYTTATTMVSFASMVGGGAVATVTADAQNRITGVGFGFHGPVAADGPGGCTVNFTIDDLAFY